MPKNTPFLLKMQTHPALRDPPSDPLASTGGFAPRPMSTPLHYEFLSMQLTISIVM